MLLKNINNLLYYNMHKAITKKDLSFTTRNCMCKKLSPKDKQKIKKIIINELSLIKKNGNSDYGYEDHMRYLYFHLHEIEEFYAIFDKSLTVHYENIISQNRQIYENVLLDQLYYFFSTLNQLLNQNDHVEIFKSNCVVILYCTLFYHIKNKLDVESKKMPPLCYARGLIKYGCVYIAPIDKVDMMLGQISQMLIEYEDIYYRQYELRGISTKNFLHYCQTEIFDVYDLTYKALYTNNEYILSNANYLKYFYFVRPSNFVTIYELWLKFGDSYVMLMLVSIPQGTNKKIKFSFRNDINNILEEKILSHKSPSLRSQRSITLRDLIKNEHNTNNLNSIIAERIIEVGTKELLLETFYFEDLKNSFIISVNNEARNEYLTSNLGFIINTVINNSSHFCKNKNVGHIIRDFE